MLERIGLGVFMPFEQMVILSIGPLMSVLSRLYGSPNPYVTIVISGIIGSILGGFFQYRKTQRVLLGRSGYILGDRFQYEKVDRTGYIPGDRSCELSEIIQCEVETLSTLPEEILQCEVGKYLNLSDICMISQTSHTNNNLLSHDCVWEKYSTTPICNKWYSRKHEFALQIFYGYMRKHYLFHSEEPTNDSNMKIKSWVHKPNIVRTLSESLATNIQPHLYVDPDRSLPDLSNIERRLIRLIFYPLHQNGYTYRPSTCTFKQYIALPRVLNEKKHKNLINSLVDITVYAREVQDEGIRIYNSLNTLFRDTQIKEYHSWFPHLCCQPRDYSNLLK